MSAQDPRLVLELDKKTKAAFKRKAATKGQSMSFVLLAFINRYLKDG